MPSRIIKAAFVPPGRQRTRCARHMDLHLVSSLVITFGITPSLRFSAQSPYFNFGHLQKLVEGARLGKATFEDLFIRLFPLRVAYDPTPTTSRITPFHKFSAESTKTCKITSIRLPRSPSCLTPPPIPGGNQSFCSYLQMAFGCGLMGRIKGCS
jgi:hypothetical protein